MINTDELCMGCMRVLGNEEQCSNCGYQVGEVQEKPYLPIKSTVGGRYLVGKVMNANGDGASYAGWDLSTKIPVVIREYLPDSISNRAADSNNIIVKKGEEESYIDCMTEFIRLWSQLLDMSDYSAMIDIYDIVEENNTVYVIHEYVDGITLREYLLRTPTGYISWDKARGLFMPVLSTLGDLHKAGIIHRGISPTTLVFDTEGKLRLTGFSIAEARTARGALNAQLFDGYSAIEQYGLDGQQGPWTDVYSFTAVLYRALIGSDPIDAKSRVTNDRLMIPGKFAEQLPAYVINGLINALQILPEDRTKTVEQCRAELTASPSAAVSLEEEAAFDQIQETQPHQYETIPNETEVLAEEGQFGDDFGYDETALKDSKSKNKSGNAGSIISQVLVGALAVLVAVTVLLFVLTRTGIINFNLDNNGTETTTKYDFVEVPNFQGRSFDSIKSNPEFTKHFVFAATYEYSDTVEDGFIISQDVVAYSQVKQATTINFVVSKGIEPITLTNVEGMSYDAAVALLSEDGFTVEMDTRTQKNDGSQVPYTVYKMSPSSVGKTYDKGTKVILTVWGEVATTTPSLIDIPDVTVVEDAGNQDSGYDTEYDTEYDTDYDTDTDYGYGEDEGSQDYSEEW